MFVAGVGDTVFGGLFMALGVPIVALMFLMHAVNLGVQWRDIRWRGLVPLAVCLLVVPSILTIGPWLLVGRFHWDRERYEAVAKGVYAGTHPESLNGDERRLGWWVKATRASELVDHNSGLPRVGRVVAVHFLAVSHGYAGHVGFMRVFDIEAAHRLSEGRGLDGWSRSRMLADNWYLVAD